MCFSNFSEIHPQDSLTSAVRVSEQAIFKYNQIFTNIFTLYSHETENFFLSQLIINHIQISTLKRTIIQGESKLDKEIRVIYVDPHLIQ